MSSPGPTKQEIESVFSRLRSHPANKACFDCAAKAPTWSSVTYGIFICIDCSAVHRNLGVHLTFVRSTNLDTNWTWLQLRQMQLGGNANASSFFRQHNCQTNDAQQKYNSRAAQLYRDKLLGMAQQAMKVHGTKLHLDNTADKADLSNDSAKNVAEEDFFAQCQGFGNDNNKDAFDNNNTAIVATKFDTAPKVKTTEGELNTGAPSVDLLNCAGPSVTTGSSSSSSIGVRKIQPKRSGLGARKPGGLGATKVKTNFAELEQRANLANQCKEPSSLAATSDKPLTEEEELESVASMRLAYQDLSLQKEAKLKTIDPAKAKQMERLGMGFNLRGSDVSHSALSDMETIQQTAAPKVSNHAKLSAFDGGDNFFNDYSPSMYSGSGGSGGGGGNGSGNNNGNGNLSKIEKHELDMMGFETIEPIGSTHSNITSMFSGSADNASASSPSSYGSGGGGGGGAKKTTSSGYDSYGSSTRSSGTAAAKQGDNDTTAQRKFGSAKGFGSDQFFGGDQSASADSSSNLSRFQGSNSISSSDYFGDGNSMGNRGGSRVGSGGGYSSSVNFQAPDLDDVKESVRQGVHKVAGRLSSLANDVMSSLQDKYGY